VAKVLLRTVRDQAYRFMILPTGVVMVVALLAGMLFGSKIGYSILLGGVVWWVPNFYFAHKLFAKMETRSQQMLRVFLRAEIIKLVLYGVFFILAYKFFSVAILPFLLGFMLAQAAFWLTPLIVNREP